MRPHDVARVPVKYFSSCTSGALAVGDTRFGSTEDGESRLSSPCGGFGGAEVVFAFTAPNTGTFTFDTNFGSDIDTVIDVRVGDCDASGTLDCTSGTVNNTSLSLFLQAGITYLVVVDTPDDVSPGAFVLHVTQ